MTRTCHLLHGWERIVQCVRITRCCYLPLPQDVTGFILYVTWTLPAVLYAYKGQRGNGGGTLKCMGRLLELYDCLPPPFSPQRKRERGLQSRDADGMVSGGFGVGWGRRPHRRRSGGDAFVAAFSPSRTSCGLACCSSPTCPGTAAVICQKSNTDMYILEIQHRQLLIQ